MSNFCRRKKVTAHEIHIGNVFLSNYNISLRKRKTSCIVEQGNKEAQTTYAYSCGKTFAHVLL